MIEISVYCNDVLRYTVIGDWDKVQELRDCGYFVQVKSLPQSTEEIGVNNKLVYFKSIENDEVGGNKQADVSPSTKHYVFDYYKMILSYIRRLLVYDTVSKH